MIPAAIGIVAGIAGSVASALTHKADPQLAAALAQTTPQAQHKARTTAQDFEAMFLNSMFAQMTPGLKGDGPFGDSQATGVWRSMLTDEYAKSVAHSGGVGVSDEVFRTLILQQAGHATP